MKVSGLLRSLAPDSVLASTIGRVNDAFDSLRRILTRNISLTDNIACELYTGYFTHGVPVQVSLKSLSTAQSAIVLSSTIPCIATPQVVGAAGSAQVTLAFARNAKRVQAVVLLFPEGSLLAAQQLALTATSAAPGQVIPDNSTITIDNATGTISASGGGGWKTILDLDFSAQPAQSLASNGNYTIGGLTFKRENAAQDQVAMALDGSTGLKVQPNTAGGSGTDYNNTIRNLPLVWLQLSQLGIPNFSWTTGLRVWVYVSAANYSANFDNSVVGIDGDTGVAFSWLSLRGFGAAAVGLTTRKIINSSTTFSGQINASIAAANNIQVVELGHLAGTSNHSYLFGQYSAGWPDPSLLEFAGGIQDGGGFTSVLGNAAAGNAPGSYGIVLGALKSVSGTALAVTFSRLRVDYRP